jgi:flagellar FliJ protein
VSALDSLIRLHRWQLDERKRDLATLEDLAAKLGEEQARLELEDQREQLVAAASPETAFAYAGYARRALAEAFQEMKRYEIAAANRIKVEEQRDAKRQQRVLDDLGVEGFRRKTAGDA